MDREVALACVVSPNEVDAKLAVGFLAQNGIASRSFRGLRDVAGILDAGVGCIVLVDEALDAEELPALGEALKRLPAWADVPIVLVATDVAAAAGVARDALPTSGNLTLLERPLNPHTLVSAVQVALRATARQREVGALVRERERAVQARDEFLAMLAHELRNPLAPMRNALYLIQARVSEDPVVARNAAILERQVIHVSRLVDDLVDVARLERGKVQLQRKHLELSQVVATAVEGCRNAAGKDAGRISARFSAEPLSVFVDSVRIEQVVTNLINNALKFSAAPAEIHVETARSGETAVLTVADQGIGFDPALGESLFVPFKQINASLERGKGGLGIGLTIIRRLVELHGGSVRALSDGPGRGSRFVVTLPLATKETQRVDAPIVKGGDPTPHRIVIVEDNPDIQETLRLLLTEWGHSVWVAGDGKSGVETILAKRPDFALIDIGLPGMNGYDVARKVCSEIPGDRPRLIAVTGYGQPADRTRALEAGFELHLLKPVEPAALQRLLAGESPNGG